MNISRVIRETVTKPTSETAQKLGNWWSRNVNQVGPYLTDRKNLTTGALLAGNFAYLFVAYKVIEKVSQSIQSKWNQVDLNKNIWTRRIQDAVVVGVLFAANQGANKLIGSPLESKALAILTVACGVLGAGLREFTKSSLYAKYMEKKKEQPGQTNPTNPHPTPTNTTQPVTTTTTVIAEPIAPSQPTSPSVPLCCGTGPSNPISQQTQVSTPAVSSSGSEPAPASLAVTATVTTSAQQPASHPVQPLPQPVDTTQVATGVVTPPVTPPTQSAMQVLAFDVNSSLLITPQASNQN